MALRVDSFHLLCDDILPSFKHTEEILSLLGLYFVGKVALKTSIDLLFGLKTQITSRLLHKKLLASYGKWAVAVHCSDSLSRLYVEEFAKRGLNVALVSSDEDNAVEIAEYLSSAYQIETDVIGVNFAETNQLHLKISTHLYNKEVGVLINNIAILSESNKSLKGQREEIYTEKHLTLLSLPCIIDALLPQMLLTKRAAIINAFCNFAPLSEDQREVKFEFYTKDFVQSYSKFLRRQHRKNGLVVQSLDFTYMKANCVLFSWFAFCGFLVPGPARFTSYAFDTLGCSNSTTGYWLFDLQAWFVENFLPDWFCFFMMGHVMALLQAKGKQT